MAYDFENEPVPEDLMAMIEAVDNAKTVDELLEVDAKLVKDYGLSSFLNVMPSMNNFDPTENVMTFNQLASVLSTSFTDMRDRTYAADDIKEDAQLILTTMGYDKETAEEYGKQLAYIALDIYTDTDLEITEDEMGYKCFKIYSADDMNKLLSNVDLIRRIRH